MNRGIQREQRERTEKQRRRPSVSRGSILRPSDSKNTGVEHVKVGAARSIRRHFAGHVSRTTLLTMLLPLSFASLFGALIAAAFFFPPGYDWRKCVISTLTSPYDNARGCWLPVVGIVVAMLLILPFAGYVGQRLRALSPRLAGSAGSGFALSFVLIGDATGATGHWDAVAARIPGARCGGELRCRHALLRHLRP